MKSVFFILILERIKKYCSHSEKSGETAVLLIFGFVSAQLQGLANLRLRQSLAKNQKSSLRIGCNIFLAALALAALMVTGCESKSTARLKEQNAFLMGQNQTLRQQAAQQSAQQAAMTPSVTIMGPVQNSTVPWVAGLTLAQAVATANYLDSKEPKQIIITRQGDSATLDAKVLLEGPDVPLENGDVVELR